MNQKQLLVLKIGREEVSSDFFLGWRKAIGKMWANWQHGKQPASPLDPPGDALLLIWGVVTFAHYLASQSGLSPHVVTKIAGLQADEFSPQDESPGPPPESVN